MKQPIDLFQPLITVFFHNYLPLSRVILRRGILLLVTGKAEPLDFNCSVEWEIHSAYYILIVFSQIRLSYSSSEQIWQFPSVKRREVLSRDKYRCQYCGSPHRLTLDQVISRSEGGKQTWDNVVVACADCNGSQGDPTPQQEGMKLKTALKAPINPCLAFAEQFWQFSSIDGV